jgi:hypothetical protein
MHRYTSAIALAAMTTAIALATPSARAGTFANDDFESYTAGSQLESGANGANGTAPGTGLNGGSGWFNAYNSDDSAKSQATIFASHLTYNSGTINVDGGNNVLKLTGGVVNADNQVVRRLANTQSGQTFYYGLLYRAVGTTLNDEDFVQIGLSDVTGSEPKVSTGSSGASAGTTPIQWFVRDPNGTANSTFGTTPIAVTGDVTHLLVAKVSQTGGLGTYNHIDLFLDPASLTEPGTPTLSLTAPAAAPATLNQFVIRFYRGDASDQYLLDNLNFSDTYAGAIVAPEPATLGLAAAGALTLLARRRRR